jgi:sugar phosphate isomerase/epimerase
MAAKEPFRYCMNTSTIRGQELSLEDELQVIADAGYDGVEPWIRELDAYVEAGGSLDDLRDRLTDLGLQVENAIGFFEWVVDDAELRAKGFEEARRNMDMVARIGGSLLAAPPFGATDVSNMDLHRAAERYADLCEVGAGYGVVPVVEFWGVSKCLGRLSEGVAVAVGSGRREACVLADVFHMYKGGSPFEGLRLVGPHTIALLHMNDYPADPPHATVKDSDRVYPGDGIAPIAQILSDLHETGYHGALSLELFNEAYWAQDAAEVAATGLAKMKALVAESIGGRT